MRIIPRSEWGARHDNGFGKAPLPASEVWLHHSVTTAPDLVAPYDDDYSAIRALEEIGEARFGRGISYTWPIMPAGLIFEGHSVDRVGSHTAGRNTRARGLCFVGNYEDTDPTKQQIQSAAWLLQHAHTQGWITAPRLNGGHRDLQATACPGARAHAAIPEINRLAAGPPIIDAPTARARKDNAMTLYVKMSSRQPDGSYAEAATADGGLISGVDYATAHASIVTWGGTEIGVSDAEWADRVTKSRVMERLGGQLDAVIAAVVALTKAVDAGRSVGGVL